MPMPYLVARVVNGVRKVATGLTPFGESVWPGVRNDLFVAHASIYFFFSQFARQQRVLDAGSGTGYGAPILEAAGATSVLGVDIDRRSVGYSTTHFSSEKSSFQVADLQHLSFPPSSFDLITSSNALEHLESPGLFLRDCASILTASGRVVLAVPPITFPERLAQHRGIHYHRSNLTVIEWVQLFVETGWVQLRPSGQTGPPLPRLPIPSSVEPVNRRLHLRPGGLRDLLP